MINTHFYSAALMGLSALASGLLVHPYDLLQFAKWTHFISPIKYAGEILAENEFKGTSPLLEKVKSIILLKSYLGQPVCH